MGIRLARTVVMEAIRFARRNADIRSYDWSTKFRMLKIREAWITVANQRLKRDIVWKKYLQKREDLVMCGKWQWQLSEHGQAWPLI